LPPAYKFVIQQVFVTATAASAEGAEKGKGAQLKLAATTSKAESTAPA